MSVGLIFAWIVLWPLVAVAVGAVPIGFVVHDGPADLLLFVIVLVGLPAALARGLSAEMFAP
jgi:hypothetical protein